MDFRQYIQDAAKVQSCLREVEGDRLVTATGCKIVIPVRYVERDLAFVGIETRIVGIFAYIVEGQFYGVSLSCAMMRITPSSTVKVMYDEDEYYEFTFDPGATVCPALKLVMMDTLVYSIYDEIFSKGRVPWYMGMKELGALFEFAKEDAGANIGQQQEVVELMASLIARDPKNRAKYYRQAVETEEDLEKIKPDFIALRSVNWAATNTLNKLAGSYAKDGLISALVTPTERVERLEDLLRR